MAGLTHALKQSNFAAVDILLRGYFHWQGNASQLKDVVAFCNSNPEFQFNREPAAISMISQLTQYRPSRSLIECIIEPILVKQSDWQAIFFNLQESMTKQEQKQTIVCVGPERCIPPYITQKFQVTFAAADSHTTLDQPNDSIAVIGMACQVPGATNVNEFWALLCNAKSQHIEVPKERFTFETPWRKPLDKKWYGNFIDDYDKFDMRFFKKSAREASSMDPQQRLILQIAYQAVEHSGYLSREDKDNKIGCYIALGLDDYEQNISYHTATAFSATGNLKAFAAGRISHYFGWTGPGITIDTACSSSAVAINLACKSILTKDCNAALVGGVNIMTGPDWYYNLDGASFLSPTGQCKPFDASADGYCRGEAVGAVFLKRLSLAMQDEDQILGVIAGSAIMQNANCTAITVPNQLSLSNLFRNVIHKSGLSPNKITYVEAHGTGTPVGDPAEYDAIKSVFGAPSGKDLTLGSVKGLLGHSEAASGIVALIKTLLMIQNGVIPAQASFKCLSPALKATSDDRIEINEFEKPWDTAFKAALINNYGASGSNASLLVTQPPSAFAAMPNPQTSSVRDQTLDLPFMIYGLNHEAVKRYALKLVDFIHENQGLSLADISFHLARQRDISLPSILAFDAKTKKELKEKLEDWPPEDVPAVPAPQKVILCFGGQRSTFVGLDRKIYDSFKIFRNHLDECQVICKDLGTTIYPTIFETQPVLDIVRLHAALFSMQYSCAKSWMDCMPASKVTAVIGHSFGELVALCIAGVMSQADMLEFIVERARLIQRMWGPEKGSMLAVQGSLETVNDLLAESNSLYQGQHAASIACFNGLESFTLAGPRESIDTIMKTAKDVPKFSSLKTKLLNVTNAYHCSLVDLVLPQIEKLVSRINMRAPAIHVELTTEHHRNLLLEDPLSDHIRRPVYFSYAVQRLAEMHSPVVWLEAGSNSGVALMAKHALENMSFSSDHHFQSVNISLGASIQGIGEATVALWKSGINTKFWAHHCSQANEYQRSFLPPYQFEKSSHWLKRKVLKPASDLDGFPEVKLWELVESHPPAKFRLKTSSIEFENILKGHTVWNGNALCPSTLQLEIAIDALAHEYDLLFPDSIPMKPFVYQFCGIVPIFLGSTRDFRLEGYPLDREMLEWDWKIISSFANADPHGSKSVDHATGKLKFYSDHSSDCVDEFEKIKGRVDRAACTRLLKEKDVDSIIQGEKHIYKLFQEVVNYGKEFRGLQKLVSKGRSESAGRVRIYATGKKWFDYRRIDYFCQVAGIFINVTMDRLDDEMFVSDKIFQWSRSPHLDQKELWQYPPVVEVYASHQQLSVEEFTSDVFVFDPDTSCLIEAILGIHYKLIPKRTLVRIWETFERRSLMPPKSSSAKDGSMEPSYQPVENASKEAVVQLEPQSSSVDVFGPVREIVANLSGIPALEIKSDSQLADIGIDSLMGMELIRELEVAFKQKFGSKKLNYLTDFKGLVELLEELLDVTYSKESQAVDMSTPVAPTLSKSHEDSEIFMRAPKDSGETIKDQTKEAVKTSEFLLNHEELSCVLSTGQIPDAAIMTFLEYKYKTDHYVRKVGLSGYSSDVLPKSEELCIAYICHAFEKMGCQILSALPGQKLERIKFLPQHERFMALLYNTLQTKADLIHQNKAGEYFRTATPVPRIQVDEILNELEHESSVYQSTHALTKIVGCNLAGCLLGKFDGVQLIFGSPEGRALASHMYGQCPINTAWIQQLVDFIQKLILIYKSKDPISILELGAGTCGTTSQILPVLANLTLPTTYTVSDIAPSLVVAAKKRFQSYRFANFRVIDIESQPPLELVNKYDIILATNCVHATRSLATSTENIHKMLKPNGFTVMLEMMEPLLWVDLVFGPLEGWWAFNDGRKHALVCPQTWESTLYNSGFKRVEFTEGDLPESRIQRLIFAVAGGANKRTLNDYMQKHTVDLAFVPRSLFNSKKTREKDSIIHKPRVLITGATGSLGAHLAYNLAQNSDVGMIICLNRPSKAAAQERQEIAFRSKGIDFSRENFSKLHVIQKDLSKELFYHDQEYQFLIDNVTHIVHNAWPMSMTRPIAGFEAQFSTLERLLQLAVDIHAKQGRRISFYFISSISVVGLHPLCTASETEPIPELPSCADQILPNGYSAAKYICEEMVASALQKRPEVFKDALSVRIGQIAGSRVTGYWNPVEHLASLVKSSQMIGVLPGLKGTLSWCPVDDVAAAVSDFLLPKRDLELPEEQQEYNRGIYHIENPVRQRWEQMIQWLSTALGVQQIVPFEDWVNCVRQQSSLNDEDKNPAGLLLEFWEKHFVRMSTGSLVLSTERSRRASPTLSGARMIDQELLEKYIQNWRSMGFL